MVVAARAVKEVTVKNRILESGEQFERFKAGKRACSLILLRYSMSFPSYIFVQHLFVEWSKDKKAQTSSEHYSLAKRQITRRMRLTYPLQDLHHGVYLAYQEIQRRCYGSRAPVEYHATHTSSAVMHSTESQHSLQA